MGGVVKMEAHHSTAVERDAEIESFVSDFAVFMEVEGLNGSLLDVYLCAGDFYSPQHFRPQFDLLSKEWHAGDLDRRWRMVQARELVLWQGVTNQHHKLTVGPDFKRLPLRGQKVSSPPH